MVNLTPQASLNQMILDLFALISLNIQYLIILAKEMRQRSRWLLKDVPWGTGRE